jgi:ubiquitin C-terminal hydrolase
VHSGTADVGHYYTIVKKDKDWIKFDDSRITNFPTNMFEEECYGGNWIAD